MPNKIKTTKQQDYYKSRCKYCNGTGVDTFNKSKPCPNCSDDPAVFRNQGSGNINY